MCLRLELNRTHVEKQPGTVEKNSSTIIGPPAGIEPTPLRGALTLKSIAPASQRRRFDSCRRTYS